jgi:hypothetical protein
MNLPPRLRTPALLALMSFAALLVHGYHPGAEDGEIYLPGILKLLHPALFPHDGAFFASHAGMTAFPWLIATSIRVTHLWPHVVLLLWHVLSIFLTLWACLRIARLCFKEERAAWCGTALVGSLLTLPVAGTALYIMDPYLTSRSLVTPAGLFAVGEVLAGNYAGGLAWILVSAAVHPLMALFAAAWAVILVLLRFMPVRATKAVAAGLPAFFPPVTSSYQEILRTRPYFLLTNWAWYEWLGIFAPLLLLVWFTALARKLGLGLLGQACQVLVTLVTGCLAVELVIGVPGRFENFAELQLMRCLQLAYTLLFLFGGCLLGKFVQRRRPLYWMLLFVPLCAVMFLAQRQLFAASDHVEWPGARPRNPMEQAFRWVRHNTPENAYFSLDPDYMNRSPDDEQGFRAIARRSMLADANKDAGAASMFPELSGEWERQVNARRGWERFQLVDFERLKAGYGVDWAIVAEPGVAGLQCPYRNAAVLVCRVP